MAPAELREFTLNSPLPLQTFLSVLPMSVHDTTHRNLGILLGSSLSLSNHVQLNKNFYQFCSITLSLTCHFFFILAVHHCVPSLLIRSLRQLINLPPHQQSSNPTIFFPHKEDRMPFYDANKILLFRH